MTKNWIRVTGVATAAVIWASLSATLGYAQKSDPNIASRPAMGGSESAPTEIRAQLSPKRQTVLSAELATKINKIWVREGQRFSRGAPLVEFDCATEKAQLDRAAAVLAVAQSQRDVNAKLETLGSIGAMEVAVARSEVRKALAEREIIRAKLKKCIVVAPWSGAVAELAVRTYQYVKLGDKLLEIVDNTVLEVEAIVPSRWRPGLRVGDKFTVDIEETGGRYEAKIIALGARIDAVSQTVKVTGQISSSNPGLISGMSGRALFTPAKK
jgi:membrane fusion protein (multidrug efflux system)